MRRAPALVLLVALLAAPAAAEGLRGYLAVQGDRPLTAENADALFTPASVQKLVVTAAVLHHLGAEYRIETRVVAGGPVERGRLSGDLILEAAGDPTWSRSFFDEDPEAPLAALARQVRAAGIGTVAGDLVADLGRFPGLRAPLSRPVGELGLAFSAPVAGLALAENAIEVRVAPGPRIGAPGLAATEAPVELENEIVTVGAERHEKGSVVFLPRSDRPSILVRGEYPISEGPYVVEVSMPAPELAVLERLREHLSEEGVALEGGVRVERSPGAAADAGVLARFFSPPLREVLVPVLTESSNWIAEMLLQLLARELTGEGRIDDGVEVLADFLEQQVGAGEDAFFLDDASGLSAQNLLAPRTVVELLRFAWRASWRDAFFAALARPGAGTLEGWPYLPPLHAKTGTLRHHLALAGLLETGSARGPVLFAVFLNHDLRPRPRQRRDIADLVRLWRSLATQP